MIRSLAFLYKNIDNCQIFFTLGILLLSPVSAPYFLLFHEIMGSGDGEEKARERLLHTF